MDYETCGLSNNRIAFLHDDPLLLHIHTLHLHLHIHLHLHTHTPTPTHTHTFTWHMCACICLWATLASRGGKDIASLVWNEAVGPLAVQKSTCLHRLTMFDHVWPLCDRLFQVGLGTINACRCSGRPPMDVGQPQPPQSAPAMAAQRQPAAALEKGSRSYWEKVGLYIKMSSMGIRNYQKLSYFDESDRWGVGKERFKSLSCLESVWRLTAVGKQWWNIVNVHECPMVSFHYGPLSRFHHPPDRWSCSCKVQPPLGWVWRALHAKGELCRPLSPISKK